jgi:hypothetical protein
MRNILEFPITMDEVITTLDTACQRANDDDNYGSVDAFVLSKLLEMAEDNRFEISDFE